MEINQTDLEWCVNYMEKTHPRNHTRYTSREMLDLLEVGGFLPEAKSIGEKTLKFMCDMVYDSLIKQEANFLSSMF